MISFQSLLIATTISLLLAFVIFYYLKKNNFLLDQVSSSAHKGLTKNLSSKKVIVCGGIIIFFCCVLFFDNELLILKIFAGLILIVGIFSDINKFNSPKFRILLQSFIVLSFLLINENLTITDLRIDFINKILTIKYVSIIFTMFCMLILINGSNFLDGINTLVVGYYILVLVTIVITSINFNLNINLNIFYLITFLSIIFLFNFFNRIYLGDAGSYLVSFLTAFFVLDFYLENTDSAIEIYNVSPYFICLLLWYPAFENLFSILRRIFLKKRLDEADQGHLHQMIYCLIDKNRFFDKRYINTATGILINLFNLSVFIISYQFYSKTNYLVCVIFFNIFIYLMIYFILKKKNYHT